MESRSYPYFDPEYETSGFRSNPPRIVIDNGSYEDATLVKVDSANIHGILLDVVQVLSDLELIISKAHISYDVGWFMDVFHVTDQCGRKINDESTICYIQQTLGAKKKPSSSNDLLKCPGRSVGVKSVAEHTIIELTGKDRPGLLSEVSAVLAHLKCNVYAAEVWTHNLRVACVVYVTDEETGGPVNDLKKLDRIRELLSKVMGATMNLADGITHTERRLHQMMFADRDYEGSDQPAMPRLPNNKGKPIITVHNCSERGYSLINVQCADRPKLLFDTVCTLTDMQYVVFHATVDTSGSDAFQEYYVRQMDGCTLDADAEERVKKCLEAAIERRSPEGLRLELCTSDRVGLLSDVTRIFRENGLSVTRADVTTQGDKAVNVFYVTDASGNPVDMKIVEALRRELGQTILEVKEAPRFFKSPTRYPQGGSKMSFSNFFKSSEKFLYGLTNLGLTNLGWRNSVCAA